MFPVEPMQQDTKEPGNTDEAAETWETVHVLPSTAQQDLANITASRCFVLHGSSNSAGAGLSGGAACSGGLAVYALPPPFHASLHAAAAMRGNTSSTYQALGALSGSSLTAAVAAMGAASTSGSTSIPTPVKWDRRLASLRDTRGGDDHDGEDDAREALVVVDAAAAGVDADSHPFGDSSAAAMWRSQLETHAGYRRVRVIHNTAPCLLRCAVDGGTVMSNTITGAAASAPTHSSSHTAGSASVPSSSTAVPSLLPTSSSSQGIPQQTNSQHPPPLRKAVVDRSASSLTQTSLYSDADASAGPGSPHAHPPPGTAAPRIPTAAQTQQQQQQQQPITPSPPHGVAAAATASMSSLPHPMLPQSSTSFMSHVASASAHGRPQLRRACSTSSRQSHGSAQSVAETVVFVDPLEIIAEAAISFVDIRFAAHVAVRGTGPVHFVNCTFSYKTPLVLSQSFLSHSPASAHGGGGGGGASRVDDDGADGGDGSVGGGAVGSSLRGLRRGGGGSAYRFGSGVGGLRGDSDAPPSCHAAAAASQPFLVHADVPSASGHSNDGGASSVTCSSHRELSAIASRTDAAASGIGFALPIAMRMLHGRRSTVRASLAPHRPSTLLPPPPPSQGAAGVGGSITLPPSGVPPRRSTLHLSSAAAAESGTAAATSASVPCASMAGCYDAADVSALDIQERVTCVLSQCDLYGGCAGSSLVCRDSSRVIVTDCSLSGPSITWAAVEVRDAAEASMQYVNIQRIMGVGLSVSGSGRATMDSSVLEQCGIACVVATDAAAIVLYNTGIESSVSGVCVSLTGSAVAQLAGCSLATRFALPPRASGLAFLASLQALAAGTSAAAAATAAANRSLSGPALGHRSATGGSVNFSNFAAAGERAAAEDRCIARVLQADLESLLGLWMISAGMTEMAFPTSAQSLVVTDSAVAQVSECEFNCRMKLSTAVKAALPAAEPGAAPQRASSPLANNAGDRPAFPRSGPRLSTAPYMSAVPTDANTAARNTPLAEYSNRTGLRDPRSSTFEDTDDGDDVTFPMGGDGAGGEDSMPLPSQLLRYHHARSPTSSKATLAAADATTSDSPLPPPPLSASAVTITRTASVALTSRIDAPSPPSPTTPAAVLLSLPPLVRRTIVGLLSSFVLAREVFGEHLAEKREMHVAAQHAASATIPCTAPSDAPMPTHLLGKSGAGMSASSDSSSNVRIIHSTPLTSSAPQTPSTVRSSPGGLEGSMSGAARPRGAGGVLGGLGDVCGEAGSGTGTGGCGGGGNRDGSDVFGGMAEFFLSFEELAEGEDAGPWSARGRLRRGSSRVSGRGPGDSSGRPPPPLRSSLSLDTLQTLLQGLRQLGCLVVLHAPQGGVYHLVLSGRASLTLSSSVLSLPLPPPIAAGSPTSTASSASTAATEAASSSSSGSAPQSLVSSVGRRAAHASGGGGGGVSSSGRSNLDGAAAVPFVAAVLDYRDAVVGDPVASLSSGDALEQQQQQQGLRHCSLKTQSNVVRYECAAMPDPVAGDDDDGGGGGTAHRSTDSDEDDNGEEGDAGADAGVRVLANDAQGGASAAKTALGPLATVNAKASDSGDALRYFNHNGINVIADAVDFNDAAWGLVLITPPEAATWCGMTLDTVMRRQAEHWCRVEHTTPLAPSTAPMESVAEEEQEAREEAAPVHGSGQRERSVSVSAPSLMAVPSAGGGGAPGSPPEEAAASMRAHHLGNIFLNMANQSELLSVTHPEHVCVRFSHFARALRLPAAQEWPTTHSPPLQASPPASDVVANRGSGSSGGSGAAAGAAKEAGTGGGSAGVAVAAAATMPLTREPAVEEPSPPTVERRRSSVASSDVTMGRSTTRVTSTASLLHEREVSRLHVAPDVQRKMMLEDVDAPPLLSSAAASPTDTGWRHFGAVMDAASHRVVPSSAMPGSSSSPPISACSPHVSNYVSSADVPELVATGRPEGRAGGGSRDTASSLRVGQPVEPRSASLRSHSASRFFSGRSARASSGAGAVPVPPARVSPLSPPTLSVVDVDSVTFSSSSGDSVASADSDTGSDDEQNRNSEQQLRCRGPRQWPRGPSRSTTPVDSSGAAGASSPAPDDLFINVVSEGGTVDQPHYSAFVPSVPAVNAPGHDYDSPLCTPTGWTPALPTGEQTITPANSDAPLIACMPDMSPAETSSTSSSSYRCSTTSASFAASPPSSQSPAEHCGVSPPNEAAQRGRESTATAAAAADEHRQLPQLVPQHVPAEVEEQEEAEEEQESASAAVAMRAAAVAQGAPVGAAAAVVPGTAPTSATEGPALSEPFAAHTEPATASSCTKASSSTETMREGTVSANPAFDYSGCSSIHRHPSSHHLDGEDPSSVTPISRIAALPPVRLASAASLERLMRSPSRRSHSAARSRSSVSLILSDAGTAPLPTGHGAATPAHACDRMTQFAEQIAELQRLVQLQQHQLSEMQRSAQPPQTQETPQPRPFPLSSSSSLRYSYRLMLPMPEATKLLAPVLVVPPACPVAQASSADALATTSPLHSVLEPAPEGVGSLESVATPPAASSVQCRPSSSSTSSMRSLLMNAHRGGAAAAGSSAPHASSAPGAEARADGARSGRPLLFASWSSSGAPPAPAAHASVAHTLPPPAWPARAQPPTTTATVPAPGPADIADAVPTGGEGGADAPPAAHRSASATDVHEAELASGDGDDAGAAGSARSPVSVSSHLSINDGQETAAAAASSSRRSDRLQACSCTDSIFDSADAPRPACSASRVSSDAIAMESTEKVVPVQESGGTEAEMPAVELAAPTHAVKLAAPLTVAGAPATAEAAVELEMEEEPPVATPPAEAHTTAAAAAPSASVRPHPPSSSKPATCHAARRRSSSGTLDLLVAAAQQAVAARSGSIGSPGRGATAAPAASTQTSTDAFSAAAAAAADAGAAAAEAMPPDSLHLRWQRALLRRLSAAHLHGLEVGPLPSATAAAGTSAPKKGHGAISSSGSGGAPVEAYDTDNAVEYDANAAAATDRRGGRTAPSAAPPIQATPFESWYPVAVTCPPYSVRPPPHPYAWPFDNTGRLVESRRASSSSELGRCGSGGGAGGEGEGGAGTTAWPTPPPSAPGARRTRSGNVTSAAGGGSRAAAALMQHQQQSVLPSHEAGEAGRHPTALTSASAAAAANYAPVRPRSHRRASPPAPSPTSSPSSLPTSATPSLTSPQQRLPRHEPTASAVRTSAFMAMPVPRSFSSAGPSNAYGDYTQVRDARAAWRSIVAQNEDRERERQRLSAERQAAQVHRLYTAPLLQRLDREQRNSGVWERERLYRVHGCTFTPKVNDSRLTQRLSSEPRQASRRAPSFASEPGQPSRPHSGGGSGGRHSRVSASFAPGGGGVVSVAAVPSAEVAISTNASNASSTQSESRLNAYAAFSAGLLHPVPRSACAGASPQTPHLPTPPKQRYSAAPPQNQQPQRPQQQQPQRPRQKPRQDAEDVTGWASDA